MGNCIPTCPGGVDQLCLLRNVDHTKSSSTPRYYLCTTLTTVSWMLEFHSMRRAQTQVASTFLYRVTKSDLFSQHSNTFILRSGIPMSASDSSIPDGNLEGLSIGSSPIGFLCCLHTQHSTITLLCSSIFSCVFH